jgi:hypothetical protein
MRSTARSRISKPPIVEAGGSFAFGMSSGAALALEAAARGLATTRLALFEPPFIVDDSRPRRRRWAFLSRPVPR